MNVNILFKDNLKNIIGKDLADFLVYYTITDDTANKKEGYIVKLSNSILKNGETFNSSDRGSLH